MENTNTSAKVTKTAKALNITAIVLCVILLPILVFNCILLVKGMINADEVPSVGKYIPLIVESPSMEETIMTGDLIISKKVAEDEVKVGDVITFFDPATNGQSVVTHRIIEAVYEDGVFMGYKTQGDNNETPELDLVVYDDIIGVWTETRIPTLGSILLFTQKPLGLIICIFIPIACFVAVELLTRYKKDKASKNDIDALRAELEALKKEKENIDNK